MAFKSKYGSARLRHIYEASPQLVKDLMATGYGLRLRRRKYGAHFHQYLQELTQSQWWSDEQLAEYQNRRLQRFVQHAAAKVPYYRDLFHVLGTDPREIRCVGDLTHLPLLEKETVRSEGRRLMAEGFDPKQIVWFYTSGTTGKALELPISRECFQREYAFRWLHYSWAGIRPGERNAMLAQHPVTAARRVEPPFWVTNHAEHQLLLSSLHVAPDTVAHYARKLRSWQPAMIHGFPSALYLLALGLADENALGFRPRAIFTASETLLETQRSLIESVFGCKIFNWYGQCEMVANIVECDLGSMHVKHEHSVLEFLNEDGRPARPGELAEIVGTGYGNEAYPLIRYRTGDTVVLAERPCECGRAGTIVRSLTGRLEDIVVTRDGRYDVRLDGVFKDAPNVREAQLVQETPDQLTVRIVRREGYGPEDTARLRHHLRERLGHQIQLEFQFMDQIPRGPNGKYRFVVSKVGLGIGWPGARETGDVNRHQATDTPDHCQLTAVDR